MHLPARATVRAPSHAAAVSAPTQHVEEHQHGTEDTTHALEERAQPAVEERKLRARKAAPRISLHVLRGMIRGGGKGYVQHAGGADVAVQEKASRILTLQIMKTRSWQEAFTLFTEFSDVFSATNTAALVTHISKLICSSGR